MSDEAPARFRAELDVPIGKPVGPAGPRLAPEEVDCGHAVTRVTTDRDAKGEVAGRQRFRLLKLEPEAREEAPS